MAVKKEKGELISIREFARRVDVSDAVVRRAIKRGRISTEGEGRQRKVKWPQAEKEFNANRDFSKVRKKEAAKIKEAVKKNGIDAITEPPDLWKAKAKKEEYLAKLRELEYLERSGQLGDIKAMEDAAFKIGRLLRDSFLIIPDRISGLLANETDERRVHDILTTELEAVLNKMANDESR